VRCLPRLNERRNRDGVPEQIPIPAQEEKKCNTLLKTRASLGTALDRKKMRVLMQGKGVRKWVRERPKWLRAICYAGFRPSMATILRAGLTSTKIKGEAGAGERTEG